MSKGKLYNNELESFIDSIELGITEGESDFRNFIATCNSYQKIAKRIKKILPNDLSEKSLIKEIPDPEYSDLKEKKIMAVDGGQYNEPYKSAVISFSNAHLYKNENYFERHMNRFNIITLDYNSLTTSVLRATLEYEIALRVLQEEVKKNEIPDLVLFDGTLTFPDDALEQYIDRKPDFQDKMIEYKRIFDEYLEFSINNNIPTVAVIKDSISNKFLNSFKACMKNDYNNNFELGGYFQDPLNQHNKDKINHLMQNQNFLRFSELTFINSIFEDKINLRTKYVPIEKNYGIKNNVCSEQIKEKLLGFYARFGDETCYTFFIEIPSHFKEKLEEITRILSSFSTYSIVKGYPQPLFIAHKKAKMNPGKIFSRINYMRYRLSDLNPEAAKILLKRKFHVKI